MLKKFVLAIVCLTVMAFVLSGRTHAFEYEIVDIGTLPGAGSSHAFAVNNNGQVVGTSVDEGRPVAFLWDNGEMHDISEGQPLGYSYANDINDAGQIAGEIEYGGIRRAFRWDITNGMRSLGTAGGQWAAAQGINGQGDVVGNSVNAMGQATAFYRWHDSPLTAGTQLEEAFAINDNRKAVGGRTTVEGEMHAYIWRRSDGGGYGAADVGTLGGSYSMAYDINNLDQVVGVAETTDGPRHAFLWESGSWGRRMTDLGTLHGGPFEQSEAYGINELGQAVGRSSVRAFVWDNEHGMRNLFTLLPLDSGWSELQCAYDINDHGQIVGWGNLVSGEEHAFLLTPIPEPCALSLLCLGGLALRRRRRA